MIKQRSDWLIKTLEPTELRRRELGTHNIRTGIRRRLVPVQQSTATTVIILPLPSVTKSILPIYRLHQTENDKTGTIVHDASSRLVHVGVYDVVSPVLPCVWCNIRTSPVYNNPCSSAITDFPGDEGNISRPVNSLTVADFVTRSSRYTIVYLSLCRTLTLRETVVTRSLSSAAYQTTPNHFLRVIYIYI